MFTLFWRMVHEEGGFFGLAAFGASKLVKKARGRGRRRGRSRRRTSSRGRSTFTASGLPRRRRKRTLTANEVFTLETIKKVGGQAAVARIINRFIRG